MSGSIKSRTSIHNEHRIINVTNDVKSFEFKEYYLRNDITTFSSVKKFLPISISEDYRRLLPNNFFDEIFSTCKDNFSENNNSLSYEEKESKRQEYFQSISDLSKCLSAIIKPYVSLIKSDKSVQKGTIETFIINNCLVDKNNKDILTDKDTDRHYPAESKISYISFHSLRNEIKSNNFVDLALKNVKDLIVKLCELSNLSAYLTVSENSFRSFVSDIITSMSGNTNQLFPRSIINYTAFQFCIKGYPYETPSERIYSVSNVNLSIKNKFDLIDVFYKNLDAIFNFFDDININDKEVNENNKDFEIRILKNAYGTCIILCALIGEMNFYDRIISSSLDGSILNNHSLMNSIFFNKNTMKINEVHE